MNLRKFVSSIVSVAVASAFLVTTGAANASTQAVADADFWNLGSERPLVAKLASASDPSQVLTPSEIKAATSVSLVFPKGDINTTDFRYQWLQSTTDNGCAGSLAGPLGNLLPVPTNGVISMPSYTANRYVFLMIQTDNVPGTYARTQSVEMGDAPKFCNPVNVSLATAIGSEESVRLTFSAGDTPAHLVGARLDISAYLIPADGPVPDDLSDFNQEYPYQVGCTLTSCFIFADSSDVGVEFDVVFRAQWLVDNQWQSSYYSIARVSVTPLGRLEPCSRPDRTPQCSPVELLIQPTVDISGGTSPGDTVVVSSEPVWDTDADNLAFEDYSWWWAESCTATRWLRTSFMNMEIPFTVSDFSVFPSVTRQVQDGLVFRMAAEFDNGYLNLSGYEVGPSFIVGGGFCSNSVSNDDSNQETTSSDTSADVVRAAPYTGPVLNTPAITSSVVAGAKVVIPGSNLAGVSSVEIGGVTATVVVNSDGELEITIPAGLAAGTYDLVVVSSSGRLTVQNAITVSGSVVDATAGAATPSTKRMDDDSAKVWVFDAVGAGKVQIFVNGKEIAWVNATDANDSKLFNGYLVRTVELAEGKNVIEVFVDGERERRTVYSN